MFAGFQVGNLVVDADGRNPHPITGTDEDALFWSFLRTTQECSTRCRALRGITLQSCVRRGTIGMSFPKWKYNAREHSDQKARLARTEDLRKNSGPSWSWFACRPNPIATSNGSYPAHGAGTQRDDAQLMKKLRFVERIPTWPTYRTQASVCVLIVSINAISQGVRVFCRHGSRPFGNE
jgi:hypothetical protein